MLTEPAAGRKYQMLGRRKELILSKEVFPPLPAKWSGEDVESVTQPPHLTGQDSVIHRARSSVLSRAKQPKKPNLKREYHMHQLSVTSYTVLHKKPKEVDTNLYPLKWQRLKALKCLNCTNEEVVSALYNMVVVGAELIEELGPERVVKQCVQGLGPLAAAVPGSQYELQSEKDCVVHGEAAKALVTLGCWEEQVVLRLVEILIESTGPLLEDIIVTLRKSLRDLVQKPKHQELEVKSKEKLVSVLTSLMTAPHSKDMVPVQAAACLCYLNSKDQKAIEYTMSYLHHGDTYQKKQALEVVLKYLGIHEAFPIQVLLEQIQTSPIYKHRLKALDLLIAIGTPRIRMAGMYEPVLEVLKKKLWDDPVLAVSRQAAMILTLLGMKRTVWENVKPQLEENDAVTRGQAVISLSMLGIPNHRVLQTLLEMLETDFSQYVQFQIIRAFGRLHLKDANVKQSLLNRQLGEGPLARWRPEYRQFTLTSLNILLTRNPDNAPRGDKQTDLPRTLIQRFSCYR